MNTSSLNSMFCFLDEDNRLSKEISEILEQHSQQSLLLFPKGKNLFYIFYFDLLKLFTGSLFRTRELEFKLLSSDKVLGQEIIKWPYIGYNDIKNSRLVCEKDWGVNLCQNQISTKKKVLSSLSKVTTSSFKVDFGNPSHITKGFFQLLPPWKASFRFLENKTGPFFFPSLKSQFSKINDCVDELCEKFNLPLKAHDYSYIIESHIMSIVREGDCKEKELGNMLITGSGCEITNRLISSKYIDRGLPVVNVLHGDSFGALDNPAFGFGEQGLCTHILGYGEEFVRSRDSYSFINVSGVEYLSGDSSLVRNILNKNISKTIVKKRGLYYFPTTLRGTTHRYGPYQEMTDLHYLEWQRKISKAFGKDLVVKAHPKDKYLHILKEYHPNFITTNLLQMYENVEIFVFDYLSTALCYAMATSQPIIYFDLGIQNIHPIALEKLRKRVLYIDVRKEDFNIDRIFERLKESDTQSQDFINSYSLVDSSLGRTDQLVKFINEAAQ